MSSEEIQETPLMRQYWEIKKDFQDAILLFRLGDFYEMFYEDAQVASKILDIALTSRDKSAQNPVPLCGVPYHSVSGYISTLLEKGHKVAICEQVEDASLAKGIVRREVVRVISPGLRTDLEGLTGQEKNRLAALIRKGNETGVAWLDVASGEFQVSTFEDPIEAEEEIWRLSPSEILIPDVNTEETLSAWMTAYGALQKNVRFERLAMHVFEDAERRLKDRFSIHSLEGLGLAEHAMATMAAGAILYYVETANRTTLAHLKVPKPYDVAAWVHIDRSTRENLEIDRVRGDLHSNRSLFASINETASAMGSRCLREMLLTPLKKKNEIELRLDAVTELLEKSDKREALRSFLSQIYDMERLLGRIATERANARDLAALGQTLSLVGGIQRELKSEFSSSALYAISQKINNHQELASKLNHAFVTQPPISIREGGMFKDGYDSALDELRTVASGGRTWIAELERMERERTGIGSLKIGYNRVFGYYIEITKTHLAKTPINYTRKQTLANAERFVTPELKEKEEQILVAQDRLSKVEYELFEKLRREVATHTKSLQIVAELVSELDVFCSMARVAARYGYVRPRILETSELKIKAGRHPVVERFSTEEPFVPNDIDLDCERRQIIILTGPNMAGKSTIMRQVGLITLMAQAGSFVPAESAEIGLVDRIFTRVGASDDVSRGRSTFMVEMNEAANILRNATEHSLVLLDEVGRGTSTFDGLAIAWSIAEDLHDRVRAKTIFATHYHELTDLARTAPRVVNMNVAVKEWGDKIVFLRTLREGAVNRSYGIEVARLAGVPENVILRARTILKNLENGELDALGQPLLAKGLSEKNQTPQLELFRKLTDELWKEFESLELESLSPKEALDLLYQWSGRFRKHP